MHISTTYISTLKSPSQNAIANITTPPETDYYNTSKLAFQDLTKGTNLLPLAHSVLGLGMKFIRTTAFTTGDISTSITLFKQDIRLQVFFAHQKNDDYTNQPPKLYVKSKCSLPGLRSHHG